MDSRGVGSRGVGSVAGQLAPEKGEGVASGAIARGARARGAMARDAMARGSKSGGRGRRDNALPLLVFSPLVAFPTVVKKDFRHGSLFYWFLNKISVAEVFFNTF